MKDGIELTPEVVLRAYAAGVFPMAESRNDATLYWIDPDKRGIFPLDSFHVPKRLKRLVRKNPFIIRVDTDFRGVIRGCSLPAKGRSETWINDEIVRIFLDLHRLGHAHSVECWKDGILVGGIYGVALGGAFFGESMFSLASNASKVALVHLVALLRHGGFTLFDAQFSNPHLEQFGVIEISRESFHRLLEEALRVPATFPRQINPRAFKIAVEEILAN